MSSSPTWRLILRQPVRTKSFSFARSSRTSFSTGDSLICDDAYLKTATTSTYIDHWFDSIRKPQSFYEQWGDKDDEKIRRYFCNIDFQGRLFLEETSPKNIATSIKDEKFLNFFFSRIRPANDKEIKFLTEHEVQDDYPFVSPCGKELNFVRPAATPIVFHTYREHDSTLLYGGNLQQAFDSTHLVVSAKTGRLYHLFVPPIKKKENLSLPGGEKMAYGLIRSSVAVALSENIIIGRDGDFFYNDEHKIDWLADENEPGAWAMPDDGTVG
ncbi:protein of unknown function DUF4505 containing protein [Nitzschia inconspicua]|uniref:Uncharacterized protein n=1 Tax=Nitzschia inconspicua TaxID=303405 RepID=A0A9K3PYU0_9STRA|nr:protein of unknown function DUF4505 containing protein [Nitzschia inconspicua]